MPPLEYETFGMWISIPLVIRDGNYYYTSKESMENSRWCVRERVQGLP